MSRTVLIPDEKHPITISPTGSRVTVRVGGVTVAETDKALSLAEADYPVAQYIPIGDVDQGLAGAATHGLALDHVGAGRDHQPGRIPGLEHHAGHDGAGRVTGTEGEEAPSAAVGGRRTHRA